MARTTQNQIPTINPRLSMSNTPTKFFKKSLVKFFTIWQFLPASGQRVGLRVSLNPRDRVSLRAGVLREMRIIRIILISLLLACAPGIGGCAGAVTTPVQTETSASGAEPE